MNRSILPPREAGKNAWVPYPSKKRPHLTLEEERKKKAERREASKNKADKKNKSDKKEEKIEEKKEKGRPPKSKQNKNVKRFSQMMHS